MTAQIGDKFIFRGDDHSIVAISNPINFNPQNYGIRPFAFCTGYQRAWAYEVLKELIFDKGVFVESIDHSEMARKLRLELDEKTEK